MLTTKTELAKRVGELQPGQGLELSHPEVDQLFGTEASGDDAFKAAEAFAGASDCTFFNEGGEHDQRVCSENVLHRLR